MALCYLVRIGEKKYRTKQQIKRWYWVNAVSASERGRGKTSLNKERVSLNSARWEKERGERETANPQTCREKVRKDYPCSAFWCIASV